LDNRQFMTATSIVETVTAGSLAELRAARDGVTDADLVELRLDGVADIDVAGALDGRTRPVVVTCRPAWEGGRFDGSEDDRLRLLAEAMRLGAEYVDVEWRADRRGLPRGGRTRIVLSHHDFDGLPADLADRIGAMRAEQPAIVKISVTATRLADCLTLRDAAVGGEAHVLIAMGPAGLLTRVWPAWCGSCWTYAGSAAPGQLSAAVLARRFRVRQTTAATAAYGIAGRPLGHSASPAMHNAAFADAGLDAVYVPLETADAHEFLTVAEAIGLQGGSVTVPLKGAIAAVVGAADTRAARVGAVNTLRHGLHGWEADNFDVDGFLAPLDRRGWAIGGLRVVVLGAGGAARAVVTALTSRGARVTVSARRPAAAAALARAFGVETAPWPPAPGWDLLVNATTVGMWPHVEEAPIDRALVSGPRVYDLVYNPPETALLGWAREAGADTIGGLEMLVAQACRQFEWWTGREAPAAVMARAAREFVTELGSSRTT
jgi:3-dehydroquinate dehydratase/shikimate dehydrogenase